MCIPTDRRLPKIRLRSRQLHHLLGQVRLLRRLCAAGCLADLCCLHKFLLPPPLFFPAKPVLPRASHSSAPPACPSCLPSCLPLLPALLPALLPLPLPFVQRLVLRLDGWEQGSRYPHGHLVRSLGPINSLT